MQPRERLELLRKQKKKSQKSRQATTQNGGEIEWSDRQGSCCRLLLEGKILRDPFRADYGSFALLAYERDNQRQDEAEGDPGNRQEPHEPGPQEADPEAEADVSFLC